MALEERYARIALVEQPIKRLKEDIPVAPLELKRAACALEDMAKIDVAKKHVLLSLERSIMATLRSLPDGEWKCRSRKNIRSKSHTSTDQFVLGLQPFKGRTILCHTDADN